MEAFLEKQTTIYNLLSTDADALTLLIKKQKNDLFKDTIPKLHTPLTPFTKSLYFKHLKLAIINNEKTLLEKQMKMKEIILTTEQSLISNKSTNTSRLYDNFLKNTNIQHNTPTPQLSLILSNLPTLSTSNKRRLRRKRANIYPHTDTTKTAKYQVNIVHNLSSHVLSSADLSILSKGCLYTINHTKRDIT